MKLTKVNIVGKGWYHEFERTDGSRFTVECSEQEYRTMGAPGGKRPFHPDGIHFCSYESVKADTPSGKIEPGQYADHEGRKIVNARDYHAMIIDQSFMDGDTLKKEGIDFINEHEEPRHVKK